MNRNYMVIRSASGQNDTYSLRMISGNKIPGLLRFQEKWLDGTQMFYYDITSKQPLNRLIERKKMVGAEVRTLIEDLILILRQLERFLLSEQRICLNAECIYIDPETGHGSFCLIPGYESDFTKSFLDFAQYILDHVDHSDGEAVVLAFSVFRESRKDNFGVDDIERCLRKEQKSEKMDSVLSVKTAVTTVGEVQEMCNKEYDFQIAQEEFEDKQKDKSEQTLEKRRIVCMVILAAMIGFPIIGMLLFGSHVLLRWKWFLLAGEMLMAAVGIAVYCSLNDGKEDGADSGKSFGEFELGEFMWDMEEELKEDIQGKQVLQKLDRSEIEKNSEEDMQTVLLVSQGESLQQRKLISVSDKAEILVDYFPFLIGKNKGLVDVCLKEPGISRLHAKLEREGADYFITDLNSTNGTKINGSLLEANEKRQIKVGDELEFAESRFLFQ